MDGQYKVTEQVTKKEFQTLCLIKDGRVQTSIVYQDYMNWKATKNDSFALYGVLQGQDVTTENMHIQANNPLEQVCIKQKTCLKVGHQYF